MIVSGIISTKYRRINFLFEIVLMIQISVFFPASITSTRDFSGDILREFCYYGPVGLSQRVQFKYRLYRYLLKLQSSSKYRYWSNE